MKQRLKVIYAPKGPAFEYAKLALNPYKGCTHKCVYCYNKYRVYPPAKSFFSGPNPKKDILENTERDCRILSEELGHHCPEIQLTFLGDAYQPAEMDFVITRRIIEILIRFKLPFTILTKSPNILRDVDLLGPYKQFRAGFSFTTVDQGEADQWEPGVQDIESRISALRQFKKFDKPVWVSLEPVMRVESTIKVIHELKALPDFFWIGALNHYPPPEPINKLTARSQISAALDAYTTPYKFKSSFDYSLS